MFFSKTDSGYVVRVRLTPNSSSCCIKGLFVDPENTTHLKISIVSVPEKGRANKELIDFLAQRLNIPKSSMQIIKGSLDRCKKILISNTEGLAEKLLTLVEKEQ